MSKQLTSKQRLFVLRTTQTVLANALLHMEEAGITSAQWAECDAIIVREIKRSYAAGGIVLIEKHSQRTRPGWSKVTFEAENELEARRAAKALERARIRIEQNNGYVVEAAKKDPVAVEAKRIERLTERQQARLRAVLGW